MSAESVQLNVEILGKAYSIDCPENERASLLEATEMLKINLQEMRKKSRAANRVDLVVVSGLNMAHEAIKNHKSNVGRQSALTKRIQRIGHKIEECMKALTDGKFGESPNTPADD